MITNSTEIKEILMEKDLFVFDMDGTIYLGETVFPEAVSFIKSLRRNGKKVLFFTNNASKTPEFYMIRLSRMGFEPSREEIMTSGDVTIEYLKKNCAEQKVYVVGTPELVRSFRKYGVNVIGTDDGEVDLSEAVDIVVTSFDTTLTYDKLKNACTYIVNGASYLSTHPDYNCPTDHGFLPDSGAIAAAITSATGVTPEYFGKPEKSCMQMISERMKIEREKMIMIGDRLYTDIAAGKKSGVTSLLVMTGETTPEMLEITLPENAPDIALDSLGEAEKIMFHSVG